MSDSDGNIPVTVMPSKDMKTNLGNIRGALGHILSWVVPYVFVILFAKHSSSRYVYGIITGWWCALYVGYILKINFSSFLFVFLMYMLVGFFAIYFNFEWFYHDVPDKIDFSIMLIILCRALFFASPIILNYSVLRLMK